MSKSLRIFSLSSLCVLAFAALGAGAGKRSNGSIHGVAPAAASHSNLLAPLDVTACVDANGNLNIAWCAVDGATKYSIEVEASYNLGTACGDATLDFDFGTDGTSLEIPISTFDNDFGSGAVPACSLSVKVKGLNPPQKRGGRQNNPFTEADQNPIDPTVTTCLDVDTPIAPTCP